MEKTRSIQVPLQTLTPLWTGGADGKVDRVHETSLTGGLRWWYELLLRGVGAEVKDPLSNQRSALDTQKFAQYRKSGQSPTPHQLRQAGLCDAAQVFGATGWRRRFQLSVEDRTAPFTGLPRPITADPPRQVNRGWYLPGNPCAGQLDVTLTSFNAEFDIQLIAGLLQFVIDWAGIGAKNQMGMGIVRNNGDRLDTQVLLSHLQNAQIAGGRKSPPRYPSLDNLFLAAIQAPSSRPQEAFNLKYDLRRLFDENRDLRHFIMGTVQGKRIGAKINMSLPYADNLIRIWGWVPHQAREYPRDWNRERIVTTVHHHLLTQSSSLLYWHELNSPRDTWLANNPDPFALLSYLLNKEGSHDL